MHVEVQGYNDKEFAKRMYSYFYRILDRYNKPVTCIAIFTDSSKNFKPATFSYNFLGTENYFKYNTYKVIDQQESELRNSNNPFALVILAVLTALKKGKIPDEKLLNLKMSLVKLLLQKEIPKPKIESILIFLRDYVRFDNAEIMIKFDTELNLITNKHTTVGIKEFLLERAKKEGDKIIDQKNHDFVEVLLTETDFTVEKIANKVGVTISFVEDVKASLALTSK